MNKTDHVISAESSMFVAFDLKNVEDDAALIVKFNNQTVSMSSYYYDHAKHLLVIESPITGTWSIEFHKGCGFDVAYFDVKITGTGTIVNGHKSCGICGHWLYLDRRRNHGAIRFEGTLCLLCTTLLVLYRLFA